MYQSDLYIAMFRREPQPPDSGSNILRQRNQPLRRFGRIKNLIKYVLQDSPAQVVIDFGWSIQTNRQWNTDFVTVASFGGQSGFLHWVNSPSKPVMLKVASKQVVNSVVVRFVTKSNGKTPMPINSNDGSARNLSQRPPVRPTTRFLSPPNRVKSPYRSPPPAITIKLRPSSLYAIHASKMNVGLPPETESTAVSGDGTSCSPKYCV